jgi:hypothetical protein
MTVMDTKEPADRDAGEQSTTEQPTSEQREADGRQDAGPAKPVGARAPEREDPFALDPLSPPSGRPW